MNKCFEHYFDLEFIEYKCDECGVKDDNIFKKFIVKCPPLLVIHFKRFAVENTVQKNEKLIDFDFKILDIKKYYCK